MQWVGAATAVLLLFGAASGDAHKPITSPYTFNEDVFPIVRERCGQCHVAGGVAPMSLMTHQDGVPWGESIRAELIAGHMPPWNLDTASSRFRNVQPLTARELNVLLTWVTGGTPIGDSDHAPPRVEAAQGWRLGPPDLILPMPAEVTLPADVQDATREFTVATRTTEARWLKAVDVLPGNAAVVRNVAVLLKLPDGAAAAAITPERVLALWVPGDTPVPVDDGAGFALPAGAEVVVRIHYKKTWEHERAAMTDRSSVGLYFADGPAEALWAMELSAARGGRPAATSTKDAGRAGTFDRVRFTQTIAEDLDALAIYPDAALANAHVRADLVRPDGSREELIAFRPQANWARRYWFARALPLPRGSTIEVSATFNDALLPPGATPPATAAPDPGAVRLTLNVVRATR
jgi:hypothetical protein